MKEKNILYVTKGGERCDEGFSYVKELALTLKTDIIALIIYPDNLFQKFENMMTAVTFAEAGDFDSARAFSNEHKENCRKETEEKMRVLSNLCDETSIKMNVQEAHGDTMATIKKFLEKQKNIGMILVSPSLTQSKKLLNIKTLMKLVSKPIVVMSRSATTEA